jgi:PucR family transcriptional regulator, purine catabolism regulatory protein
VMARGFGADKDPDGDLVDEVAKAARAVQRSALVGRVRPQMVAVLFGCPSPDAPQRLPERLVEKLGDGVVAALAVGQTARGWRDLPMSLTEAEHVASVAPAAAGGQRPVVVRARDLGIRSLLWQIRDDSRLHSFIESRLGPVLALRSDKREETLHLLESYLQENGVMVPFARRVHLGRTAAYARIRSLERLLQSNLSNSEERTSMHVALIAYRQDDRGH